MGRGGVAAVLRRACRQRLGRPVFNIGEGSADLDGYGHLLRYAESHGARVGTLIVSVCMENDLRDYGPGEPEPPTAGFVSEPSRPS